MTAMSCASSINFPKHEEETWFLSTRDREVMTNEN